jgi:hypothetical protein
VVTLNLTITNSTTSSESVAVCETYTWNGQTYTTSGVYTYSTTNAAGCDSTATLNLTINNSTTSTTSITNCDSYSWNGNTYTNSGTYTYSTTNAAGCDSTATLVLLINYPTSSVDTIVAVESYNWHGTLYTQSDSSATWTGTNSVGCDSLVSLYLIIVPIDTPLARNDYYYSPNANTIISDSASINDIPYHFGGVTWSLVSNPSHSSNFQFNTNGTFSYTPTPGFIGIDTFYYKVCDANSYCQTAMVVITIANVVAVESLDVNAVQIGSKAKVNWNVQNESNVYAYEIERSENGNLFRNIGSITPNNSQSNMKNYVFYDQINKTDNVIYYRIKTVKNNGDIRYSSIVSIKVNTIVKDMPLYVYPNPFVNSLNLNFDAENNEKGNLRIINMQGKIILVKPISIATGKNNIQLNNLDALSKGSYTLELITNQWRKSITIIKQ